jgi:hypothetical protein
MFFLQKTLIKYLTEEKNEISPENGSDTYDKLSDLDSDSDSDQEPEQDQKVDQKVDTVKSDHVVIDIPKESPEDISYYKTCNNKFYVLDQSELDKPPHYPPKSLLESDHYDVDHNELKLDKKDENTPILKSTYMCNDNDFKNIEKDNKEIDTYRLSWKNNCSYDDGCIMAREKSLGSFLESLPIKAKDRTYTYERMEFVGSNESTRLSFKIPRFNLQNFMLKFSCNRLKEIAGNLKSYRDAYSLIRMVELRSGGELLNRLDGYGIWFWNQLTKAPDYDYFNKKNIEKGELSVFLPFDFFSKNFMRRNTLQYAEIELIVYTNAKCYAAGFGDVLHFAENTEKCIWEKQSYDQITRTYSPDIYPFNYTSSNKNNNNNNNNNNTFACSNISVIPQINICLPLQNYLNVTGILFYLIDENDQMIIDDEIFETVRFSVKTPNKEYNNTLSSSYYSVEDLIVNGFFHLGVEYSEKWKGYYWIPFARKNDHDDSDDNNKCYSSMSFSKNTTSILNFKINQNKYDDIKKTRGEMRLVVTLEQFNFIRYTNGSCGLAILY